MDSPAVLSDSEESIATSQVSLLWSRVHALDIQVWHHSRAIDTSRASRADESARYQVLASLVQELKSELAAIKRLLSCLQGKIQRCEQALDLEALD